MPDDRPSQLLESLVDGMILSAREGDDLVRDAFMGLATIGVMDHTKALEILGETQQSFNEKYSENFIAVEGDETCESLYEFMSFDQLLSDVQEAAMDDDCDDIRDIVRYVVMIGISERMNSMMRLFRNVYAVAPV